MTMAHRDHAHKQSDHVYNNFFQREQYEAYAWAAAQLLENKALSVRGSCVRSRCQSCQHKSKVMRLLVKSIQSSLDTPSRCLSRRMPRSQLGRAGGSCSSTQGLCKACFFHCRDRRCKHVLCGGHDFLHSCASWRFGGSLQFTA